MCDKHDHSFDIVYFDCETFGFHLQTEAYMNIKWSVVFITTNGVFLKNCYGDGEVDDFNWLREGNNAELILTQHKTKPKQKQKVSKKMHNKIDSSTFVNDPWNLVRLSSEAKWSEHNCRTYLSFYCSESARM